MSPPDLLQQSEAAVTGPGGNSIRVNREAEPPYVDKTYGVKPSGWKGVKYALLRGLGRDVPVEYQPPARRCEYEAGCLRLWEERGLSAPRLLEPPDVQGATPRLRMELCVGATLEELLRDGSKTQDDKLAALSKVLRDMRWRHCAALVEIERRFIHTDANLRNTLITPDGPVSVDFEMGRGDESLERSCVRELKKLCLTSLEVLGRDALADLARRVFYDYGVHRVLEELHEHTTERPFSAWHVQRDERRKRKRPGLVTKYDLAAALEAVRQEHWARRRRVARDTAELKDAELTSWDGKFYQSLDDADPRGRDMQHRYEIMQFPADFSGKSILDIGCNMGRICIDAAERGAVRAVGIDFRADVMEAMDAHCRERGLPVELRAFDIDDGVDALVELIGDRRFDYVCALSIWSHVDTAKFWQIVERFTGDAFLLEDNYSSRVQSIPRMEELIRQGLPGARVEFLGFTTDRGPRSVFRARR